MDMDKKEELELESEAENEIKEADDTEDAEKNPENAESSKNSEASKKKKKKFLLIIPAVFLSLLIIVAGFINHKLKLIHFGTGLDYTINTNESPDEDENIDFGEIDDVTGSTYKEILKNWATAEDAQKLKSNHIINILLIGSDASSKEDSRAKPMEERLTDAMIIASINTQDKTIKLVSIMRDSYMYLKGYDRFAKLNSACKIGGPAYLVDIIEDSYKIEIDGYAMVDFDAFIKCIDIVGGVNVDVPEKVGKKYNMPYGDNVLLNGEQALSFCRERKLYVDSDISRTRNQRMVINDLISKCKLASVTTLNSVVDTMFSNIHTSFTKKEAVNYMSKAISEGWANYTVTQRTYPTADARYGYSGSEWIWVIDYPLAAQKLQTELYGTTNIKLEEDRVTAITVMGGYVTEDKGD